jgi:hypothetical protein
MKDITHSAIRFTLIGAALAAGLAASSGARATEIIGAMANESGGEILMTASKCGLKGKHKNGLVIMATGKGGTVSSYGCAYPLPPARVFVDWDSGRATVLPMSAWTPNAVSTVEFEALSDRELDALNIRLVWFNQGPPAPPARAPREPRAQLAVGGAR